MKDTYDNQLYYFSAFLCVLFLSSNLINKEFLTNYRKIRSNATQWGFLVKMGLRKKGVELK